MCQICMNYSLKFLCFQPIQIHADYGLSNFMGEWGKTKIYIYKGEINKPILYYIDGLDLTITGQWAR